MTGSPSAERVVSVVDFLASHPGRSFGLSELARALGLSKATAHALCTTLTESGWLLRHPADKSYTLGPALIAAGHTAGARQLDLVDHARPVMEELAGALSVQVVASSTVGDEMVLLATAGRPGPMWLTFTIGQRVPLAPPLGTVFLAWAGPEAVEHWLDRLGPGATEDDKKRLRSALGVIRRRGYALNLEAVANLTLSRALTGEERAGGGGAAENRRRALEVAVEELAHEEYLLQELEAGATYRLSQVSAPVFGSDGAVALALTVMGLPEKLTGEEIPRYGDALVDAAERVTRSIHGRPSARSASQGTASAGRGSS
jgi:DNA-binding IclR family transcriptional regulator